VLILGLS
jgi:hypothetical protein